MSQERERYQKKSNVLKERMYEQDFALKHGKRIILHMTMQLTQKTPTEKALHLFASANNLYGSAPGIKDAPQYLIPTEHGPAQFQLTKAVAARVAMMNAVELAQFEKGGYIGIGCILPDRDLGNTDKMG